MNKKIGNKKIICSIILLCCVVAAILIGPCNILRGGKQESTIYELPQYTTVEVNQNISQQFSPRYAHIRGIRIVMLNTGESMNNDFSIVIRNVNNEKELYREKISSKEVVAGEWVDIDTNWKLNPGNSYNISFESDQEQISPIVFKINGSFDVEENQQLFINGKYEEGGLAIGYLYYESFSLLYRLIICFLIISIAIFLIAYIYKEKTIDIIHKYLFYDSDIRKPAFLTGMIILGAIIIFIHVYKIIGIPFGVNVDEMGMGYDAYCLANYGVDRYFMSWPVYFVNWGSGQNALYTFSAAILVKIFGYSLAILRTPAIINALITWYAGARILYYKTRKRYSILAFTALFCILPNYLINTRFGLESLLMMGMTTLFLFSFWRAVDSGKMIHYILSGFYGGVMLYTYAISYVTTIIFLLIFFMYTIRCKKFCIKRWSIMAVVMGILAMPLILEQIINIFDLPEMRLGIFTIPRMPYRYRGGDMNFKHIPEDFLLTLKTIFLYDTSHYSSFPQFLTMYWISIPFTVVGIIYESFNTIYAIFKKKWNGTVMITLWFWSMFFVGCIMGGKGPNCFRLNGIYFATTFMLMSGLSCLIRSCKQISYLTIGLRNEQNTITHALKVNPTYMKILLVCTSIIYVVCFANFFEYYFYRYAKDYYPENLNWSTHENAVAFLDSQGKEIADRTTYMYDIKGVYLAGTILPSPYDYQYAVEMKEYKNYKLYYSADYPQEIDYNANYLVSDVDEEQGRKLAYQLEKAGFSVVKIDTDWVCWIP